MDTTNKEKRKKVFVTFGGPTKNYHNRVYNLCVQAISIQFFNDVFGFTDFHLKNDISFWKKHGDFIESNPRGYGFWLWKPFVIKKSLENLELNDILIYADAGCNFNFTPLSLKRLNEYVEMVDNSVYGILTFQLNHKEIEYTKYETFEKIISHDNENIAQFKESGQCIATIIIMRKNPHTVNLVNEWLRFSEMYDLINDKHTSETSVFKDHRHDQSIFSLLVKKLGSLKIPDETFFHPNWYENGINYPIWATRQRF